MRPAPLSPDEDHRLPQHHHGPLVGPAGWRRDGAIGSGVTEVPVLLVLTDGGVTGIGLGAHADVARVFPALDGEDPER